MLNINRVRDTLLEEGFEVCEKMSDNDSFITLLRGDVDTLYFGWYNRTEAWERAYAYCLEKELIK